MASTEITTLGPTDVASSPKATKPGLSGPLSIRQTRMMGVANLYIHRGGSETEEQSYLDTFEQLKGQFKSLLEYYEGCREARLGGSKAGCSDETWDLLTRKVTGKGPSLRKALEKQNPHKMSLKQILDLVSFINTMELLLPSTQTDLSCQSSPHVHSPRLNGTQSHSREAPTGNLDGSTDSPAILPEDYPSPSRVPARGNLIRDDVEQGLVGEVEESSTTMTNNSDLATPPGGITYQIPAMMTSPGTEVSPSRFSYSNRTPPNSRVSQILPFQRLSTLLSTSLSGGACTPGGGCAIGPKPPPSGATPVYPTGIVSNPDDIHASIKDPSRASCLYQESGGYTSTVEEGTTPPANCRNTSGQPANRPKARPLVLTKGDGLQRPKNPLGKILEEEYELSESIRTKCPTPALAQLEDACTAAMVRSQSNILGSLFMHAYPRPKPTATDTLLYWLLQDHTTGDDIPTFSRGQDQKSLFRLMICLWAEPIVGSGPFDKEWKRLLREREMRRWSEVGGEADVNVVSVLVMMSLFGAEVGLGLCRGQSKIRHRPVMKLENQVPSTRSNTRTVTSPPRTPITRSTSDSTAASGALSLPGSREGVAGVCPVCKRKGSRSTVCSCAYSLLQGMGVFAPTIPRNVLPPPPTLHGGRSAGRRVHSVGQISGADSMVSGTRSLPVALHTTKRPHTATQRQPLKVEVKRRPSTARDASPMSPLEPLERTYSRNHSRRVDQTGKFQTEKLVNTIGTEEAETSTNKVSTIHLDWDPTSTSSVVKASQTEDPSACHPLQAISDTTLSETPALSEAYHNAQEVQSEYEQDVNSTLFGATAIIYAGNAQSPETPAPLVAPEEDIGDFAEERLTPLTNKQVNLLSEDERASELAIARKGKIREAFVGSGLFTSTTGTTSSVEADQEEFQDEDRPPQWMQARSHSGSVGL
ncbi:hypothetical protein L211DRAFT_266157 [Terfezia boudieri ATCC MYA-4762]|uniref:Uncharacterized protein n=1 Tax=Terfezia boudieri ATCC MYA-4762 TaxID=1051890 RepID=A0A3N4M2K5_9PEZI|nr:hypothetical protein L211DRAFT_266157 [Terfezia boudieri ATCC MYA-4762]